ncbi:hypothetical protein J6590_014424 [Homalodisca vitripennis]|nr:hypothetical protein J6590_014424 [Homalodisca vitripennis]
MPSERKNSTKQTNCVVLKKTPFRILNDCAGITSKMFFQKQSFISIDFCAFWVKLDRTNLIVQLPLGKGLAAGTRPTLPGIRLSTELNVILFIKYLSKGTTQSTKSTALQQRTVDEKAKDTSPSIS